MKSVDGLDPVAAQEKIAPSTVQLPARRTAKEPGTFTVVATGDILLHEGVNEQARRDGGGRFDYSQIMASIKPVISGADLAICHLETPLAPAKGPFHGYPSFSVPPQILPTLKGLGYDTCSTASNHTLDQGTAGVTRTLKALDKNGLRHTGSARTAEEAQKINLMNVADVPVAQLSYTYGFNGYKLPSGMPWMSNRISAKRIIAEARRARQAGAKVVIVSLHWGTEYRHEPNAQQLKVAQKLLTSAHIDLIVGHHAHVVQPIAQVGGKYVAYGMGNLLAKQIGQPRNEGLITRFTFGRDGGRWKVTKAEFVPTLVDQSEGVRLYDVLSELRRTDLTPARRKFLKGVARRTTATVRSAGLQVPPAAPVTGLIPESQGEDPPPESFAGRSR